MTRFEIEKRIQLISGFSRTISLNNLLDDELTLNKMLSFLTTSEIDTHEKLLAIIPRGERYQYMTEQEKFVYNMNILNKCLSVVDNEEQPIEYKTIEKYRFIVAKRFVKEVDKSMKNIDQTPYMLMKCE